MSKVKRLFAGLLILAMVISLIPVSALATEQELSGTGARGSKAEMKISETEQKNAADPVQNSGKSGSEKLSVHVNPLYEGIISEADIVLPEVEENTGDRLLAGSASYLTEEQAGEQLRDYLKSRTASFTIHVKTDTYDYEAVAADLLNIAFAHTGVPTEGDYLMWQWATYGGDVDYAYNNGMYDMTFYFAFTYYTTLAQENQMNTVVNNLLNSLNVYNKSDYEKVCAVYDYICDHVVYDYEHLYDPDYTLQFTAYAALINKTAVCQGYALLFYRLMLELGVDNRLIAGEGGGEAHGWNIVKLGDVYYNVDSTWDAGMYSYSYFLRNMANFQDHVRYEEYNTPEFHTQYPMSSTDYVDGVEGEPDLYMDSGICGDNAYWNLTYDGTLTIYGTGPTYDYVDEGYEWEFAPWWEYWYATENMVVEEGITYLGDHLMCYTDALQSVTLPDSLEGMGDHCFAYCVYLTSVAFPENLDYISSGAFSDCYSLTEITFTGDAPYISDDAFAYVYADVYYPGDNATWTSDVRKDYGGSLNWISTAPDVTFVGASLSLKGDIGLNYYAALSERILSDSTAYMNFTGSGADKQVAISEGVYDSSDDSYRYSVALNAKNMGDDVTAQVYNAGGAVGDGKTLSIKYYADYVINNSSREVFVNLMKAMLNYGAAAQVEFGYDTANLVNADMAEADRTLPATLDVSGYAHTWSGEEAGIEVTSASLLLQSETKIRIYFKLAEGKTLEDFAFTVNGETVTPVQSGEEYYIERTNVAAKDLDTMYTFRLGNRQLTYCGLSYVNQVVTYSKDADLLNLVKSLYAYNQAANAYFGA